MGKIYDAYAQRRGVAKTAFRLLYEGVRIQDEDTPDSLELGEGDEHAIMAVLEQTGGAFVTASS